jgi:streptomycin 6-kinase
MTLEPLHERVDERRRVWNIVIEDTLETPSSFIAFGTRNHLPVVLKVIRQPGEEWRSGHVLRAFGGNGIVRVLDYIDGALLLERLIPATSLVTLSLGGRDDEATDVLAGVVEQLSARRGPLDGFDTVEKWGAAFDRYLAGNDRQIPNELVGRAKEMYGNLCATQQNRVLLHGDLQHYNVLLDETRGWVAIDPKGVVGEVEYEIGASLRNPCEAPEFFASPEAVMRRLERCERSLALDYGRVLQWSFAQAVLSAVWSVEDGYAVAATDSSLMLAQTTAALLG